MRLRIPHKNGRDRPYLEDMLAVEDWRNRTLPDTPWNKYTPVLTGSTTNPTLGTGAQSIGRWQRIERTCLVHVYVAVGGAGFVNGAGNIQLSLPNQCLMVANGTTVGGFGYIYNGVANLAVAEWLSNSQVAFRVNGAAGVATYAAPGIVAGSVWAFQLVYEAVV